MEEIAEKAYISGGDEADAGENAFHGPSCSRWLVFGARGSVVKRC